MLSLLSVLSLYYYYYYNKRFIYLFFYSLHWEESTKNTWEKSHSPSCSAMQMMNKVKDLHMMEGIIIPCVISWCVRAAAVRRHTPGGVDEQQQVLCVHVPAGTSAYIPPSERFHTGHSYLCAVACICRTMLLHNTHTLTLYLPSSHSNSDLKSQYRLRPPQGKKGMVAYLYQLRCLSHWL